MSRFRIVILDYLQFLVCLFNIQDDRLQKSSVKKYCVNYVSNLRKSGIE